MNLRYQNSCSDGKKGSFETPNRLKLGGIKAAAAMVAFLSVGPIADQVARAQDAAPVAATEAPTKDSLRAQYDSLLTGLDYLSKNGETKAVKREAKKQLQAVNKEFNRKKINMDKVNAVVSVAQAFVDSQKPEDVISGDETPAPPAEEAPVAIDAGVEEPRNTLAFDEAADAGVIVDPFANDVAVAKADAGVDEPVVAHNMIFSLDQNRYTKYMDPALAPFVDQVDISGKKRGISMNNSWDLGMNFVGNEAAQAVFGAVRYRDLARLDLGNMWFGEQAAPFARIMLRPELNIWRFKGVYYGSVAFAGNMPSWVYTSHSAGLGYSQPIGQNFRLRLGIVSGGALSHPAWDDIYFNLTTGLSMEFYNKVLIYGVPTFYFAASDPMKTAYIGNYDPKFQDVEVGVQVGLNEYTIRGFADIGLIGDKYGIYNRYGFRGTRTVDITNEVAADLWLSLGVTHWSAQLGGRVDPAIMLGATFVIGGDNFNSTNTMNYSHMQSGGEEFATTDFPTTENPGPYGFGRSGNPAFDVPINETKDRIVTATSFEEFKSSYGGTLSPDEVVLRARFLGAFLQQVAYANDAYNALTTGNIFDSEVKRIAGADEEQIFSYIKGYIDWYQNHGVGEPLPANLKNGIAVCAGIHWLMAEFMRANGVDAIVMTVNTRDGPHVITAAQLKDQTALLDYGNMYTSPEGTLDQTMRFYGRNKQAPTFQSYFYGPDGYMGTYVTSEGRLLHETIGVVNTDVLKKDFLGVR
ncbi:MAG: hypothetical protein PHF60_05715 [Candidatus ainarchaeum sp.]|nr:hypothetical protein [Candidatus ainarchaeum sp.]